MSDPNETEFGDLRERVPELNADVEKDGFLETLRNPSDPAWSLAKLAAHLIGGSEKLGSSDAIARAGELLSAARRYVAEVEAFRPSDLMAAASFGIGLSVSAKGSFEGGSVGYEEALKRIGNPKDNSKARKRKLFRAVLNLKLSEAGQNTIPLSSPISGKKKREPEFDTASKDAAKLIEDLSRGAEFSSGYFERIQKMV